MNLAFVHFAHEKQESLSFFKNTLTLGDTVLFFHLKIQIIKTSDKENAVSTVGKAISIPNPLKMVNLKGFPSLPNKEEVLQKLLLFYPSSEIHLPGLEAFRRAESLLKYPIYDTEPQKERPLPCAPPRIHGVSLTLNLPGLRLPLGQRATTKLPFLYLHT